MKYYGYPNVRILDGGLVKWKNEGRELQSGEYPLDDNTPDDPQYYNFELNADIRVNTYQVEQAA